MAQVQKKRLQPERVPKPRKRQRADISDGSAKLQIAKTNAVSLDALSWTEVPLPDRFEDAEGFFGLEEIENVEVVRNADLGKLEYRVARHKPRETHSTVVSDASPIDQSFSSEKEAESNGEWEGFENSPVEVETSDAPNNHSATSLRKTRQKAPKVAQSPQTQVRVKKESQKPKTVKLQSENEFEALVGAATGEVDVSAWQSLGLASQTLSSLARLKFASPTPIQVAAIPEILDGHDVIGKAVTGSGKTIAFGIPILEHYLKTRVNEEPKVKISSENEHQYPPVALILSPTRELAHQLSLHLSDLCSNALPSGPSIATMTGGLSLHKQQRLLANADIVVGTPGRLWEIISGGHGLTNWLQKTKYLVIDEADRLLSDGNFKEVDEILNALDRTIEDNEENGGDAGTTIDIEIDRQTLVFSATYQKDLQQKLAGKGKPSGGDLKGKPLEYLLKKLNFREEIPRFIDVDPVAQMASSLKEGIVECGGLEKDLYLYALLLHNPHTRTLIFTNSITCVRRLTPFLQNLGISSHALHSQMPQKARLRSVERFSSPSSPASVLIATDVAARGLDIPSVQLVIHYHLPRTADMYVHRSGRTARATKSGSSVLLCAPEEVLGVQRLVAKVHARNSSLETDDGKKFLMHTIELDRRIVARLRPRVALSKKISDSSLAKEKKGHEENWLRTAAEDLGVDYDSEEFAAAEGSKKGRGQGRKKAEKEARGLTKGELGSLRAELKQMLSQRVNVGVSERYLTAGGVDVDELLSGRKSNEFLGRVETGFGAM
ncbi:ATP-dependent RNA helicase [Pseudocyphellaria aurata]|nr:ATP-dependent RNA helicase [Pseudocyphellaria aurata]